MSNDQAKAFIERMKTDISFMERVLAIETIDKRMIFINREGFKCTADEIRKILANLNLETDYGFGLCHPLCHPDHCWC